MKSLPLHIQSRIWNSQNWGILADVRLYTQTQGGCPYKGDVAGKETKDGALCAKLLCDEMARFHTCQ